MLRLLRRGLASVPPLWPLEREIHSTYAGGADGYDAHTGVGAAPGIFVTCGITFIIISKTSSQHDSAAHGAIYPLIVLGSTTRIIEINRPERFACVLAHSCVPAHRRITAATQSALLPAASLSRPCVTLTTTTLCAWRSLCSCGGPGSGAQVLTGKGGCFCAGFDLKEVAKGTDIDFAPVGAGDGPMGPTRYQVGGRGCMHALTPRSRASRPSQPLLDTPSPADWSWRCGATCAWSRLTRRLACSAGASACRSLTAGRCDCPPLLALAAPSTSS